MIDAVTGKPITVPFTGVCIRGGSGLGDSLYVRPIAEHYVSTGQRVIVKSNWPEVFEGSGAKIEPFTRQGTNVIAHYTSRKACANTNQWQDVCINAGVPGLELSFKWAVKNQSLVDGIKAKAQGRPVVMVNGGRPPMGRLDGYGNEMLPKRAAFDAVLAPMGECFTVEVGHGREVYPLSVDLDLADKTSVSDMLDLASVSAGMVGQCSFFIPLAEALGKPLLCVWASAGLVSKTLFISQCTPQKILSRQSSRWVMDDWEAEQIQEVARAFCRF